MGQIFKQQLIPIITSFEKGSSNHGILYFQGNESEEKQKRSETNKACELNINQPGSRIHSRDQIFA